MRIESIDIRNFGKLKDFSLSFEEGFNVLYGENEQGKSTIMAFVRMMLYGMAGRAGDLTKSLRKRYSPWDGSPMSGSLEFSHDGASYRLEKTFAATPKSDVIRLWNKTTNESVPLGETREIGRLFLGIGEDAFEKSVFIGQIGSVIHTDKDKDNEIIQKLQNLASSGDETQSFQLIGSRLQTAIEKIRSKSGRIGILDRLQQEQSRLEEEKVLAIDVEDRKERMQRSFQDLLAKKEHEDAVLAEKSMEAQNIRDYSAYKEFEGLIQKYEEVEALSKEQAESDRRLAAGDCAMDPAFLNETGAQLQDLNQKQLLLHSVKGELSEKEKFLTDTGSQIPKEIGHEEFETARLSHQRLLDIDDRIQSMRYSLQQDEFVEKNVLRIETAIRTNQVKIDEYFAQIDQVKQEEARSPKDKPGQDKIRIPTGVYIAASIFLLSFVITGILIHPFFYLGGLVLLFVILATWALLSRKMKAFLEKTAAAPERKERSSPDSATLQFMQKELEERKRQRELLLAELAELTGDGAENPRSSADIRSAIETWKQKIREAQESLETDQASLQAIFLAYGAHTFEEFSRKHVEARQEQNRREDAARDIRDKRTRMESLQQDFAASHQKLLDRMAKIQSFPCGNLLHCPAEEQLKKIKEEIDELTLQFYAAQRRKAILDEKKKDLSDRLKSRTIDAVRETFNAMTENLRSSVFPIAELERTEEEIQKLDHEIDLLKSDRSLTQIAIAKMKSEMAQAFLDQPELAVTEDRLLSNRKQQSGYQEQLEALTLAKNQMEKSFLEMQQTFGPIVNKKTAAIFSQITRGKYQDLLVSKDLNISFRDPLMDTTQEWQYLSGGTIDQVYFSLRLAISGFLSEQTSGLPLFIDDAFLQYDDARTRQGMLFLTDYAKTQGVQILYFTCHKNLFDQCGPDTNRTDLSEEQGRTGMK